MAMFQHTQAISSKDAASLDKDLMEIGGWSLDQLMELAGLSVSQASKHHAARTHHKSLTQKSIVCTRPALERTSS